ncbi:hypothetical protein [Salinibius halmophilus]|uniref:hypothetical protein n=1 Tax=Salinibius halmophilus TaxID=1853216 RepID=UPI001314C750|nr:hypothetical protein [Salinibius halmophilus]
MKKILLGFVLAAASTLSFAATTNDINWDNNGNALGLEQYGDQIVINIEVVNVDNHHPLFAPKQLGIYPYSTELMFPFSHNVEKLPVLNGIFVGNTASFTINTLTGVATNAAGESLNIGNEFGWYMAENMSHAGSSWYVFTNNDMTRFRWTDYEHTSVQQDQNGNTVLHWEIDPLTIGWSAVDISLGSGVITAVTAPGTLGLLLAGMLGLAFARRRAIR